jgi:enoyl-CoA hydratase/carnithine racemase
MTLAVGREAFYGVENLGFDAALDRLQAGLTAISLTEDAREGVMAFVERRPPRWNHA